MKKKEEKASEEGAETLEHCSLDIKREKKGERKIKKRWKRDIGEENMRKLDEKDARKK